MSFLLLSAITKQVEISKCSVVTQLLSVLAVNKADYGKGLGRVRHVSQS